MDFFFVVRLVTKVPFLGIKCHMCHTSVLSLGHGHTLVFLWSTSFGFGSSLEYFGNLM